MEKLRGWNTSLYGPLRWGGKSIYGNDHQIMLPFYMKQVDGKAVKVLATLEPAE